MRQDAGNVLPSCFQEIGYCGKFLAVRGKACPVAVTVNFQQH